MNEFIVVLNACGTKEESQRIAYALVDTKLAACVQILPQMESVYRWQGAVEVATEHLLLIKTSRVLFDEVQAKIREMHSYVVPEILAFPALAGSDDYLAWMRNELRG